MALEQEFKFYQDNKKKFYSQYNGKFIVIKGKEIIGIFNNRSTAIQETKKNHSLGTFLVEEITKRGSIELSYFSSKKISPESHPTAIFFDYKKKIFAIITKCGIKDPHRDGQAFAEYNAIWDTGATNSAITPGLAASLGLLPTGKAQFEGAFGGKTTNTYDIEVELPNNNIIKNINVGEIEPAHDSDIVIGMDIIGRGDFAISGGRFFSYCTPPFGNPTNFAKRAREVRSNTKDTLTINLGIGDENVVWKDINNFLGEFDKEDVDYIMNIHNIATLYREVMELEDKEKAFKNCTVISFDRELVVRPVIVRGAVNG